MKACVVNYNFDPKDWWLEYGLKPEDVLVYDRSDDGLMRNFAAHTIRTKNKGDVDYDKLGYIVDNYYALPEVFLWCKSNIFKFVEPEYLREKIEQNDFAPLLKFDHRAYGDHFGEIARYAGEIYEERNDSWYFNNPALAHQFHNWDEWAMYMGLPRPAFLPFAPGGNYIVTAERVRRYARDFYMKMRDTLDYAMHPAEAHAAERSYYLLWS